MSKLAKKALPGTGVSPVAPKFSDADALALLIKELETVRGQSHPDPLTASTAIIVVRALIQDVSNLVTRVANQDALIQLQAQHMSLKK